VVAAIEQSYPPPFPPIVTDKRVSPLAFTSENGF
jgi:hypothetical protein